MCLEIQLWLALVWLDSFSHLLFSAFEHKPTKSNRQSPRLFQADQTTTSYATHDAGVLIVCFSYSPEFYRSHFTRTDCFESVTVSRVPSNLHATPFVGKSSSQGDLPSLNSQTS